MTALALLASSRHTLTRTTVTVNPNDATDKIVVSFPCDMKGNPLAPGAAPILVYRDIYTGKHFARLCEVLPSGTASADVAAAAAIMAQNPIHYCVDDSNVRGWYVVAPDYNNRDSFSAAA